jgi:hypothetical protein
MKRRNFLTIAGIGSVVAAITSFKFTSTSFDDAVVNIIRQELPYLNLDEEGIRKFADEYAKDANNTYKLTLRGYSILGINSSKSGKIRNMISTYLLSTDFFINKMDEKQLVKYLGFYNPYKRPCANPFTRTFYEA